MNLLDIRRTTGLRALTALAAAACLGSALPVHADDSFETLRYVGGSPRYQVTFPSQLPPLPLTGYRQIADCPAGARPGGVVTVPSDAPGILGACFHIPQGAVTATVTAHDASGLPQDLELVWNQYDYAGCGSITFPLAGIQSMTIFMGRPPASSACPVPAWPTTGTLTGDFSY
jgi:hypothetical protein